jgi:hypothetical protein
MSRWYQLACTWAGRRICLLRHQTWSEAATGRTQTLQLYLPRHPPSATKNRCLQRELGERLMPCTFHYLCEGRSVSSHFAVQVGTTTGVTPQYLRMNYQPIDGCTISASTSSNLRRRELKHTFHVQNHQFCRASISAIVKSRIPSLNV